METEYLADTESRLTTSSIPHWRTILPIRDSALIAMQSHPKIIRNCQFIGVPLDNCANRRSIMSKGQYKAYLYNFGLRPSLRPGNGAYLRTIGARRTSIGTALIQLPFTHLHIVIDLYFLVILEEVPLLLCMKDMVDNGLDINIEDHPVSVGNQVHRLKMMNYFLIHQCSPTDMPFTLYTEKNPRKIYRSVGHPSIHATEGILRRSSGQRLPLRARKTIESIAREC